MIAVFFSSLNIIKNGDEMTLQKIMRYSSPKNLRKLQ